MLELERSAWKFSSMKKLNDASLVDDKELILSTIQELFQQLISHDKEL